MWDPWGFYWNADSDPKGPGRSLRLCISNKQHPPGNADAAGPETTLWVQGCGGKGSCWEVSWPWSGFSLLSVFCFSEWNAGGRARVCSHAVHLAQLLPGHPPGESCTTRDGSSLHPPPTDLLQATGSEAEPPTQGGSLNTCREHPIKLTPTLNKFSLSFHFESSIC